MIISVISRNLPGFGLLVCTRVTVCCHAFTTLPTSPPELEYKYEAPRASEPAALPWKDTVPVFLLWQEVAHSSGFIFFHLRQHWALGRGSTNCGSSEMKPGCRNRLPPVLSVRQRSFSVLISPDLARWSDTRSHELLTQRICTALPVLGQRATAERKSA